MKRTLNRLLLRFSLLCLAVALGAIAVAQANRGLPDSQQTQEQVDPAPAVPVAAQQVQPIPALDPESSSPGPVAPAAYDDDPDPSRAAPVTLVASAAAAPDGGDFYAGPAPDLETQDEQPTFEVDPGADAGMPPADYADPQGENAFDDAFSAQPPVAALAGPTTAPPSEPAEPEFAASPSGEEFVAQSGPDLDAAAPQFEDAAPFPEQDPAFGDEAGPDFAASAAEPGPEPLPLQPLPAEPSPQVEAASAPRAPALPSTTDASQAVPPVAAAAAAPANQLRHGGQPTTSAFEDQIDPLFASDADAESMQEAPGGPALPPPRTANAAPIAPHNTPPARQPAAPSSSGAFSGEYGDGTLSVADAELEDGAPLGSGPSSLAITEPEPVLPSEPVSGLQGSGKPGPSELEGPQTPSLTVQKTAPPEIQVGKPAEFRVVVRNVGTVAAHEVLLRDEIPHGTELIDTNPPARQDADGAIVWEMGSIKPGDEVSAVMRVMPQMEGDIGSVATVSFQSSASARTRCTKPQLVLEHGCPRQVLVGENVVFSIKLSNPGTGAATNVVLEEDVPEGLSHAAGPQLEYAIGTLRPGETRLLELRLKAAKPGLVDNLLFAKADANLVAEHKCQFEITAPALQVDVDGPSLRYLERPAKYTMKVANPGTAPARGVKLVAHLPKGLKFSGANNAGYYRQQDHAVIWHLAELPAKEMGTVELTALPLETGEQKIRLQATAQMDLAHSDEHNTTVEGLAALLFTLVDINDPIEVGGQTTYEIKVVNQGSKAATNLRLGAVMPDGLQPISGDGPARANVDGQRIVFEPLARLAPESELSYKIHAQGTAPGDMRIQVQLISDEFTEPIRKEESTHVYSDQ